MRSLKQFLLLSGAFVVTWALLSLIPFTDFFQVEQFSKQNERKLGEFVLEELKKRHDELDSDSVKVCLNRIKARLCETNGIPDSSVTLHILVSEGVNAFTLPNRHLVVLTGLIGYCKSPEELSGVVAHEIAHMEHGHVMKKLMKEVGLSMLVVLAGGESSGEIARETARLISSTAFDRDQEREADETAVHYLAKASVDPESFANFLFRLSREPGSFPKHLELLSTHPNSQDRSAQVLKLRKNESFQTATVLDSRTWEFLVRRVRDASPEE